VRALSVREPWATMIASGTKTLEIRSRRTTHRGPLVICASRGGGAVAVVELVACRPFVERDAWELRVTRRLSGPLVKGRLGFYDVAESTLIDYVPPAAQ
jgi:ASCH domain